MFDAVPADRQLTDLEDRALTHVLTQPASASTLSSSVVPSEHSLRIQRVVLISPHSTAPIINLWFESDPTTTTTAAAATPSASTASGAGGAPSTSPTAATLRLMVVQADGWLHAWRWNATTWRWNPYAPVLLPPSRDPRSFGAGRVAPRRRLTAVTASTPHVAGSSSSSSASASSSSSFGPSVSAGARIIFWCETYIRDDSSAGTNTNAKQQQPKNEGKKDEAKGGKSEREATPTPKGGAIKPATKKKKEFLRLCWSELWFEEAPRPVSVAGPAKPPAYRPQVEEDDDDDDGSAAHVGKANLTDTLEGDIQGLFSSKEGAWLMTATSLYHWSYHTRTLYSCPLTFTNRLKPPGGKSTSEPSSHGGGSRLGVEAVAATLHTITGELVLLGTSGEVLLCSVKEDSNDLTGHTEPTERSKQEADMKRKMSADRMDLSPSPPVGNASPLQLRRVKGKLRIQPITTCQGLIKENQRSADNEVVDVFAHRHVVGVVGATTVRMFDLRRGLFLEEVPLPKPIVLEGGLKRRFFTAAAAAAKTSGETLPVTGGLWRLGGLSIPAASVGVWGVDGLWTLQYPKVTKQAEFLVKAASTAASPASSESPLRDAAMLCKDWGLDRWYTKYLFDQATHSREKIKADDEHKKQHEDDEAKGASSSGGSGDEVATLLDNQPRKPQPQLDDGLELRLLRDSCTDLAPFLENPALIIGLLASASSSNRGAINQQLGAFLELAQPKNLERSATTATVGGNTTDKRAYSVEFTESERDQQRKAFHYTTPLNRRLMPILQHYYLLSQKLNEQSNTTDAAASTSTTPTAKTSSSSSSSSSTPVTTLAKLTSSDQLPADVVARASFSIGSPMSPAAMRRANLAQVDSVERLRAVTRGDLELAEDECPDLLLDKLLQLLLPHFEAESSTRRPGGGKGKQKPPSPAHPALLQSSAYGLTATSMSSSASLLSTPAQSAANEAAAKLKRAESFAPSRLGGEGAGAGGDGEEEDLMGSDDEAKRVGGGTGKKSRRGGNEHPFFATLCRLLYARRPSLLVPFFRLLTTSASANPPPPTSSSSSSSSSSSPAASAVYLKRAFNAIPPFAYHVHATYAEQPAAFHRSPKERELFEAQLEARVWLLCRIGQAPNALRLLLFLGRWDDAMRIVNKRVRTQPSEAHDRHEQEEAETVLSEEERKQERLEHYELFHVLFMHCIEKRDSDKLAQCWDFLPQTYGVFDVLRMAKSSLTLLPLSPSYSTIFAADDDYDTTTPPAPNPAEADDQQQSVDPSPSPSPSPLMASSSSSSTSVVTRKPFTVDDFRPQLIKMFYRMKAQQELHEKQRVGQEELARRHEADARADRQRRELEELRRQERLIVERRAREEEYDAMAPTPAVAEAAAVARRPSGGDDNKGKQQQTPTKKKDHFISIFDIVGK